MSVAMPKSTAHDSFDVAASIAAELMPLQIPAERGSQLQRGLIERVRRSALSHRDLTTIRREDGAWTASGEGLRQSALSTSGGMRVDLLKVAPDGSIPWPQDAHAQEVLVVDGTLVIDAEGSPPISLLPCHQVVLGRAARVRLTAGSAGTTLYVRSRTVDLEHLPSDEARWWTTAQNAPVTAAGLPCQWSSFLEGADAAVLHAHGDVASMLIRIAPGATLPDHGHSLDEDCFMLDGDMFLGDILMRAGDYQLARAGGCHAGISSDTGGLFYFHGAVPPPASGQSR
jgi:quercetin dioxygenase-like cupin family protein